MIKGKQTTETKNATPKNILAHGRAVFDSPILSK